MTITERIIRKAIAKWMPDHHLSWNPGKHPDTRSRLNGAVSANLDKYNLQGFEDYEEKKENGEIRDDWQAGRGTRKGAGSH